MPRRSLAYPGRAFRLVAVRAPCTSCELRARCLAAPLEGESLRAFEDIVQANHGIQGGLALFAIGAPLVALYVLRAGFMKSVMITSDGRQQVLDFHMRGDVMGLDALEVEQYASQAVSLDGSSVCAIPYRALRRLLFIYPALSRRFAQEMSRQILRRKRLLYTLGSMTAEQRIIAFLKDLALRLDGLGEGKDAMLLPMTRADVASHLGLRLETISRNLSKLQNTGHLEVHRREIRILKAPLALPPPQGEQAGEAA